MVLILGKIIKIYVVKITERFLVMGNFLKKAFEDMKENARAQHQVDKANFAAVKAESKAQWEEAKAMGKPETRKAMMQAERDEQIAAANERIAEAQARINAVKKQDK